MSEGNKRKYDSSKPEHALIETCTKRLKSAREGVVGGVAVDVFDFTYDNDGHKFKKGYVYRTATKERILFEKGSGVKKGSINLLEPNQAIDARFKIHDISEKEKVEKMLLRSFLFKHSAILRPLICAQGCLLSPNVISGITMFNQTLVEWIGSQQARNLTRGPYLSEGEGKMVSSVLEAIEEICNQGYTCDNLDDPSSYAVIGGKNDRLKILPFNIRCKRSGESNDSVLRDMRCRFATVLKNHVSSLWNNNEFDDLINLIQNSDASLDDLLGHPVLVPPRKRLILYQKYDRMTLHQRQYFNANVLVNPNWQVNARNHPVLASILSGQQFGSNAVGAFHFCNVVVSHFGQHLKKLVQAGWYSGQGLMSQDSDKVLQTHLPLLLCQRHNMICNPHF